MPMYFYVFLFLLGSAVGSFLNVIICRLETKEEIVGGRSHCLRCGQTLRWYDLIPLASFFILRGRCRYCREKISWQYPLVELATGLLFVAVFKFADLPSFCFSGYWLLAIGYWLYIVCSLLIIFVYDLRHYVIPDKVVFPAMGAVLLFRAWNSGFFSDFGFRISDFTGLLNPLLSACGAAAFFALLIMITRGRGMGWGDVKLAFLMGLFLGWPAIFLALFSAFFSGSLAGLALIAAGRKKFSSQIPFGPFLVLGTVLSWLAGQGLADKLSSVFMI